MSIKTIMVPFFGFHEETAALETAFQLAKRYNAHLNVWHVSPDPMEYINAFGGTGYVGPFYDEVTISRLEEPYERQRKKVEEKYLHYINNYKFNTSDDEKDGRPSASFLTAKGNATAVLEIQGRLADLVILPQPWKENSGIAEIRDRCLASSGRPILIVPPNFMGSILDRKIVVAWDGSCAASKTVALAMPLFENNAVTLLTILDKPIPLSPEDMAKCLRRHPIEVDILWKEPDESVHETLLQSAKTLDAHLLVMGTYRRPRFSELIFGGTTKHMLDKSNLPILVA